MDIRNLTAEQKATILKYGEDGFNANELKELGLSAKDAEALYKGLAGEIKEDNGWPTGDFELIPNPKREEIYSEMATLKAEGKYLKAYAKAIQHEMTPKYSNVNQAGYGGVIVAALTAAVVLASCTTIELPDHTTNINMDLDIKNEIKMPDNAEEKALLEQQITLLKQILEAQKNGNEQDAKQHDELMTKLSDIANMLMNAGNNIETVIDYLKELGTSIADIAELLVTLVDNDAKIIEILKAINADTQTIVTELAKQGVSLETIGAQLTAGNKTAEEMLAVQKDILVSVKDLFKGNQSVNEKLDAIIKELNKGNELSDENNKLLLKVLDAINGVGTSSTDTAKIEELLNQILAKITESVEQNFAMDEKTHYLLHDLIDKSDKLDATMLAGFTNILDKLDKMDDGSKALLQSILDNVQNFNADMKTGFADVIAKLDTLSDADKAIAEAIVNLTNVTDARAKDILEAIAKGQELDAKHYEDLRELIVKNNEIAQGTQDLVKNLGGKVDNLGERAKEILDKLGKLNGGNVTVDLSEITELLKAIKDDTAKNGETLVRIEDKLNLAAQTLNTILATVEGLGEDTKATLLKILAKIPEGCKCEGVDLTVLIEKLDKIIVELQKDPEGNHEGILDDFENTMDGLV